jgi:hypothetical protein
LAPLFGLALWERRLSAILRLPCGDRHHSNQERDQPNTAIEAVTSAAGGTMSCPQHSSARDDDRKRPVMAADLVLDVALI